MARAGTGGGGINADINKKVGRSKLPYCGPPVAQQGEIAATPGLWYLSNFQR